MTDYPESPELPTGPRPANTLFIKDENGQWIRRDQLAKRYRRDCQQRRRVPKDHLSKTRKGNA